MGSVVVVTILALLTTVVVCIRLISKLNKEARASKGNKRNVRK